MRGRCSVWAHVWPWSTGCEVGVGVMQDGWEGCVVVVGMGGGMQFMRVFMCVRVCVCAVSVCRQCV
jgi:hypothetical protein